MPGYHTFYSGSIVLTPFADYIGLRVDQINFVVCQLISLIIAPLYYHYLSPKKASTSVRLLVPLICGVSMCFFCFGPAIKHLLAEGIVCYLIMRFAPTPYVHKLIFVFAMSYLSFIHSYRVYLARSYLIDVTGPMMVLTQKVTSLAFSLHDGAVKKEADLTPIQKKELVREAPSWLEYFSYVYSFQSVLCGPLCFYSDYISFITGKPYEERQEESQKQLNSNLRKLPTDPSPWAAVSEKLIICLVCVFTTVYLEPIWPPEAVLSMNRGFIAKFAYIIFSLTLVRTQYYFAWVMADAINNAAGFGFNGYDSSGKPKWDLVSNVKIWNVETADNLRDTLSAWNRGTMYWLRRVAYERTPPRYRTVLTYVVSAWWHGFFPGYYATFLTGALFTEASRTGRRYIRPYFLHSSSMKKFYDFITFLSTRFAVSYLGITFVLLHFNATVKLYCQLYFFMHIVTLVLLFLVPRIIPKKPLQDEKSEKMN